jgi:pteridine reductase
MTNQRKVALITGASLRLGKSIAEELHHQNIDIVIHCGQSLNDATQLKEQFNQTRAHSALVIQHDLNQLGAAEHIINQTIKHYKRLDFLVNNASIFYPTPFEQHAIREADDFLNINFVQPVKLLQVAYPYLKASQGSAVNIIDIYADKGLSEHSFYTASKTALLEATKQLATQFAPNVRVNAVSPGAILWPEQANNKNELSTEELELQKAILNNTALKRIGTPQNISDAVRYLLLDAHYTTGSLVNVDGGRRLYI